MVGIWNVRETNVEKFIKEEMNPLRVAILGIGKLKRTGIGHFLSEDHSVYSGMKNRNCVAFIRLQQR